MIGRTGLLALHSYGVYADNLVLDVVAGLTEEQLTREFSPSHGSIRQLLQHMLATEAGFLARCRDQPLAFDPRQPASLNDIGRLWSDVAREREAFIAGATDAALARELDIQLRERTFRFPVWQLLVQPLVHSIHHRGELSILLTELGHPLPTLDIIIQFAQASGQPWPWE